MQKIIGNVETSDKDDDDDDDDDHDHDHDHAHDHAHDGGPGGDGCHDFNDDDDKDNAASRARIRNRLGIRSLLTRDSDDDVDMGQDAAPAPARQLKLAARLKTLRQVELSPSKRTYKDDVLIQEQCIQFLRNLITLATSSPHYNDSAELIDMLFEAVGTDRLFSVLTSKLQPQAQRRLSTGQSQSSSTPRVDFTDSAYTVAAVVYVLVHIAASAPRYRTLITQQTRLLELVLQQMTQSRDSEVRCAVCWLVTNLVNDHSHDEAGTAMRIYELRRLGFVEKLEEIQYKDDRLDVKQRALEALFLLNKQPERDGGL